MHVHGRRVLTAAVLAAAVLFAAGAVLAEDEARPKIFLEKKVFADTSEGKKSFYEVHTVAQGENLWKILNGKGVLSPAEYVRMLREFRRANPAVNDPGKLKAGQKILVPSAAPPPPQDTRIVEGKVAPHRVAKGDTLTRLLAARGVSRRDLPKYLDVVKKLNESVRDVNRILLGSTILLPTGNYFDKELAKAAPKALPETMKEAPAELPKETSKELVKSAPAEPPKEVPKEVSKVLPETVKETPAELPKKAAPSPKEAPPAALAKEVPSAPPAAVRKEVSQEPQVPLTREAPPVAKAKEVPQVALTKEVPPEPVKAVDAPAKPEAQLRTPPVPQAAAPAVEVRPRPAKPEAPTKEEPVLAPPKPPYRGMLADLLAGLGEKWADRGTLYLPVPSGGEVILSLEDFPVARFSNGTQVLIDFRGALPANIRALIMETWKNYRVVSMEGTRDAWEIVHRLLGASGYHSVKEGIARPLVIGEEVSVTLPARWVVLRTSESLLSGEVILIKEVPEKPSGGLAAVLLYADRVGIRVLPFATDPGALEGFLVGLGDPGEAGDPPPRLAAPAGGLPALDFALDFLGIPRKEGERLKIGGKGDPFQLVVQPERLFETGGKRYIADTGRMAPALKTLLRDSGYRIFPVPKEDTGKGIFQRVLKEAGISSEARRDFLLAGGEKDGYSVRATGTFLTSKEWREGRKAREAVLSGGRAHSATRALMRDLGVEIVEW
jgi:LysM repeat protein